MHPSFDEGFYVLEGELTFRVEDAWRTSSSPAAGTFALAPQGTPNTFANRSGQKACAHYVHASPKCSAVTTETKSERHQIPVLVPV